MPCQRKGVLVRVAVVINTMTKISNLDREGFLFVFFSLTVYKSITEGSQGRILETRPRAESVDECYLLSAPHDLPSLLSYCPQDHQPRDSTIHSELGLPIINQENVPQACPQAILVFSPQKFPFPQMIPAWVKLT